MKLKGGKGCKSILLKKFQGGVNHIQGSRGMPPLPPLNETTTRIESVPSEDTVAKQCVHINSLYTT